MFWLKVIFALLGVPAANAVDPHLPIGPDEYSAGMLTPNYGVNLTRYLDRLKAKRHHLVPPPDGDFFFRCYPAHEVKAWCEPMGMEESLRISMSDLRLKARDSKGAPIHTYSHTHAVPRDECDEYMIIFKNLKKDQKHVCLAGTPVSSSPDRSWIFEAYVTHRGDFSRIY